LAKHPITLTDLGVLANKRRNLVRTPVFNSYIWNCPGCRRKVLFMNAVVARIALSIVLWAGGLGQTNQSGPPQTAATEVPQHPSTTDIYEAILRYQIRSWELAADSYCIEVIGKDANKALLERFKPLPVKVASACRKRTTQIVMMRVVDKETGKMSVIFDMGKIRWPKHSEAEVDGGYLCGSECMAGGTYHVAWDGSRWVVTKFDIRVQS
jgi:hypothetical protein